MQGSTLRLTFVLLIAALLGSCSISEHVVQDGPFQKRKYLKRGWFFDPPKRSGIEELAVASVAIEEEWSEADPYLHALSAEPLSTDELPEIGIQKLELDPPENTDRTLNESDRIGVINIDRTRSMNIRSIPAAPVRELPIQEYGSMDITTTGFAFLLPFAVLLGLIALVKRIGGLNGIGSKTEFVALLMGLAGLAALAAI